MTSARDDLINRLHDGIDPFVGFDPTGWVDSTDEWDSHAPIFDQLVGELHPRVIVEVGSFLGASSRHFAAAMRGLAVEGVVVCVDTWLAEQVLWNNPRWRPVLRHVNGRPEFYKVWLANALAAGLQDYLCPLPMASANAARYLKSRGVAADLVYIDASHDEGDVYRDLALYWDLVLRPGGVMLIDDYQRCPDFAGVVHDVDQFAADRRLRLDVSGFKARFRKD